MNAQDLTDGGATRLDARRLNPDKVWWSYSQPTSGMGTTWSGVWYGLCGEGCGRRMRSPPWMPCKRPPGRRAQWVHTVPTTLIDSSSDSDEVEVCRDLANHVIKFYNSWAGNLQGAGQGWIYRG